MGTWIKIKGTQTGSFQLGLTGPILNNNSGNLQLRNSANTANADISVGNITGGNLVTSNYFAGTLTTNSQPNITSVGTLTSLTVSGNTSLSDVSIAGNIIPTSNIAFNLGSANYRFKDLYLSGNTIQLGDSNITASGNGLALPSANVTNDLSVGGNIVVTGNLTVSGTTTYVNSTNTSIVDPMIELGGNANNTSLSSNDGKDRGVLLHYYTGSSAVDAFMGWKSSNAEFTIASNAVVTNNAVTINTLGNLRANTVIANLSGNATTAGTVVTNAQPNITSLGTLVSLNVSGTANLGSPNNVIITGGTNGQALTTNGNGVLSWSTVSGGGTYGDSNVQSYIASYSGNLSAGAISAAAVTANTFIGSGSSLTGITVSANSVTGLGNLALINKDGNASNVLYGNGVFAASSGGGNSYTDCWRATSKTLTYSSGSQVSLITLPANATVDKVTVIVDTAFNGSSPGATVGLTSGTGLEYVSTGDVDLKTTDRYDLPCQLAPLGVTANVAINYTASNSTAGSARVVITYAVAS